MRKKNRVLFRIISVCMLSVMLFQLVGCTKEVDADEVVQIEPMELEEVAKESFDFIGGDDVMPILAFYGPKRALWSYNGNNLPSYYSDEFMQLIKDVGINIIGHNDTDYYSLKEYAITLLEQAEKYNLGVMLMDKRIYEQNLEGQDISVLTDWISEYVKYPSFVGAQMKDEPGHKELLPNNRLMEDSSQTYKYLRELGYFANGNLFPQAVFGSEEKYRQYVSDFLYYCEPTALCYDQYPFITGKGVAALPEYFSNMSIIREYAEEANIPFWGYVAAGGHHNDAQRRYDTTEFYVTKGEFYWNVSTLLAFGAKGINYFTLIQPTYYTLTASGEPDLQRNGLISAYGTKTRWYHYAQALNAQIATVDEVLMNSVNKGVIVTTDEAREHLGSSPYLMKGTSWRELESVDGNVLIGCVHIKADS